MKDTRIQGHKLQDTGFTLIELLVSITLMAVFLFVSAALFTRSIEEEGIQKDQIFVNTGLGHVLDRIQSVVRDSIYIVSFEPSRLTLKRRDGTNTTFSVSGQVLEENGRALSPANPKLAITALVFEKRPGRACGGFAINARLTGDWKGKSYTEEGSAELFELKDEVTPSTNLGGGSGPIRFGSNRNGYGLALWRQGGIRGAYLERGSSRTNFLVSSSGSSYDVAGINGGFWVFKLDGGQIRAARYANGSNTPSPGFTQLVSGISGFSAFSDGGQNLYLVTRSSIGIVEIRKLNITNASTQTSRIVSVTSHNTVPYGDVGSDVFVTFRQTPNNIRIRGYSINLMSSTGAIGVAAGTDPKIRVAGSAAFVAYYTGGDIRVAKYSGSIVNPVGTPVDGVSNNFYFAYDGSGAFALVAKDNGTNIYTRYFDLNRASITPNGPNLTGSDLYVGSDGVGRPVILYSQSGTVKYLSGKWLCR